MFPVAGIIYGGCTDNPNLCRITASSSINTLVYRGDQHAKVQSDRSQLQQQIPNSLLNEYFELTAYLRV